MEGEFDPDEFDKKRDSMFNDDFYDKSESNVVSGKEEEGDEDAGKPVFEVCMLDDIKIYNYVFGIVR